MTVRRIDNKNINLRLDQRLDPVIILNAHCRTDAKPPAIVTNRPRILLITVDITHRNKTGKLTGIVYQQQFLNLMLAKYLFGLIQSCPLRTRHKIFLRHHSIDLDRHIFQELKIAPRQYPNKLLVRNDRNSRNIIFLHDMLGTFHSIFRCKHNRILDYPVLRTLDLGNLQLLGFNVEILVDYPDTALLSERDRKR